jgi:ribonuclease HI
MTEHEPLNHVIVRVAVAHKRRADLPGCGAVILRQDTQELLDATSYKFHSITTPELAGVAAVTMGLRKARQLGAAEATIQSESERVISLLQRQRRTNSQPLRVYLAIAHSEANKFTDVQYELITEDLNEPARWLARGARRGKRTTYLPQVQNTIPTN